MSYDENRISDQIDGGLHEKEQEFKNLRLIRFTKTAVEVVKGFALILTFSIVLFTFIWACLFTWSKILGGLCFN
jgi:hypothetical protein